MRELKFRFWTVQESQMLYYDLGDISGSDLIDEDFWKVMQYTGLKDKNGKEIYESDIIETEYKAKGIVIWDKLAAKFAFNCDEPMWTHPIHSMNGEKEVIGNIYEK